MHCCTIPTVIFLSNYYNLHYAFPSTRSNFRRIKKLRSKVKLLPRYCCYHSGCDFNEGQRLHLCIPVTRAPANRYVGDRNFFFSTCSTPGLTHLGRASGREIGPLHPDRCTISAKPLISLVRQNASVFTGGLLIRRVRDNRIMDEILLRINIAPSRRIGATVARERRHAFRLTRTYVDLMGR